MTRPAPRARRARPRLFSLSGGAIRVSVPPSDSFAKANLILALGLLATVAVACQLGSRVLGTARTEDDQVQFIQVAPPPPPVVREVKLQPKPAPPPPDPVRSVSSIQPKEATPPPPVFGLPENATAPGGDMAVATGNTLMKPADSLVQAARPPLPPAPVHLDRQPAILKSVTPEYPAWAEEQGVTATVQLQVTIDAQGEVSSVAIASSGGSDFVRNAIKAVKQTKFQPWVRDGIAVPAQFLFTYKFTL